MVGQFSSPIRNRSSDSLGDGFSIASSTENPDGASERWLPAE
jgi:hypothetical protein